MSNNLNREKIVQKNEHYVVLENFFYDERLQNSPKIEETAIRVLNIAKESQKVIVDFSKITNPNLSHVLYGVIWGGVTALGGTFVKFDKNKNLYVISI